jgi:hypothetical protein
VLAKDIEGIAEKLPLTIGTHYLPAGLHEPDKLRRKLQAAIDRAANRASTIGGHGVCGRGTVDVRAQHPLVIPACTIARLFLGGDDRNNEQF